MDSKKHSKNFEAALDISKEQFLIAEMVHAQMGALTYQGASLQLQLKMREDMQRNRAAGQRLKKKADQYFSESKYHLEQAHNKDWTVTLIRQWHGVGMLAAMEFREGKGRSDRSPSKGKECWCVRPIVLADVRFDAP